MSRHPRDTARATRYLRNLTPPPAPALPREWVRAMRIAETVTIVPPARAS